MTNFRADHKTSSHTLGVHAGFSISHVSPPTSTLCYWRLIWHHHSQQWEHERFAWCGHKGQQHNTTGKTLEEEGGAMLCDIYTVQDMLSSPIPRLVILDTRPSFEVFLSSGFDTDVNTTTRTPESSFS